MVVGAPREEHGKVLLACADCDEHTPHELDEAVEQYRCTDCGTVFE